MKTSDEIIQEWKGTESLQVFLTLHSPAYLREAFQICDNPKRLVVTLTFLKRKCADFWMFSMKYNVFVGNPSISRQQLTSVPIPLSSKYVLVGSSGLPQWSVIFFPKIGQCNLRAHHEPSFVSSTYIPPQLYIVIQMVRILSKSHKESHSSSTNRAKTKRERRGFLTSSEHGTFRLEHWDVEPVWMVSWKIPIESG